MALGRVPAEERDRVKKQALGDKVDATVVRRPEVLLPAPGQLFRAGEKTGESAVNPARFVRPSARGPMKLT